VEPENYSRFMSHYFAFVALVAVLVLIPGPAVILVMRKAVTAGHRGALRVAAGVLAADLVWAAAAAAGVSAVIVASEPAFLALRFAGAAYLIYLGARLLLAPKDKLLPAGPAAGEDETPARAGSPRAFRQGFLCDMTNPKTLLVFTGVIPQFIATGSSPFLPALLGVTFAGLGFASLTLYSLLLARAGGVLRRPKLAHRLMRGSGGILVGFGVALAAER
jgi:threonine/homoserine/homoserine lactone efflux protein